MTLFQQRWRSKRLVRGYHGDYIGETRFKRWYLPERLPDVRLHKTTHGKEQEGSATSSGDLAKGANRGKDVARERKKIAEGDAMASQAPLGSLMFTELERRIDIVVFRCCYATSAYQARQLVVHGKVQLNGVKHSNPNTRLNPGDMVSVDPKAIQILRDQEKASIPPVAEEPETPKEVEAEAKVDETVSASAEPAATSSDASTDATESATSPESESTPPPTPAPKNKPLVKQTFKFPPYAAPFLFIPAYLETNFATCSAVYVRHPTARAGYSEVPTPFDADGEVVRFAWEWYAKMRPRMRKGKKERWTSPDNART